MIMDFDLVDDSTPKFHGFYREKSLLESLPQEILVKILCRMDHDDLESVFPVSKQMREVALIAKKSYFDCLTPRGLPAFQSPFKFEDFDEIEAPNAPKRPRVYLHLSFEDKEFGSYSSPLFE